MDDNTNRDVKDQREDIKGTNEQRPRRQNPNHANSRNRRRSGSPVQSSTSRTQTRNNRQDSGDNTAKKTIDINTGKNQKPNRQQQLNTSEMDRSTGRRRNTSRNTPRNNNTVTGTDKERKPRNFKEQGTREDLQKTNVQRDMRTQTRDNRRSPYAGKNDRHADYSRFSRNRIQAEETLEDIRRENERLEKEIWLEIADFHIMTLD